MNILFVDPFSYLYSSLLDSFYKLFGKGCVDNIRFQFKGENIYNNDVFERLFCERNNTNKYDCIISVNFYPIIARLCNERGIRYIAWTCDTPMNVLPCDEMKYDSNFIFVFDRYEFEKYRNVGYERFFYMTLGINISRYDIVKPDGRYNCEISFLGKLYRSKISLIKSGLSQEMISYIDQLVSVQYGITDKFIVDDLISQPIIDEINRQHKIAGHKMVINKEQLSYSIAEHVTYLDRVGLLETLGRRHDVHLYSYDIGESEKSVLQNVKIHGPLEYDDEMPALFKSSKININSSLRAARSAIPLRALDVMGCGGFLLSNSQPELEEYFENGKEVVLFHSPEEAIDMAEYYLSRDSERKRIASAGYEKVKRDFNMEDRIMDMLRRI